MTQNSIALPEPAGARALHIRDDRCIAYEYELGSPGHILLVGDAGLQVDGEIDIDGLPRRASRDCDFHQRIHFIPAGHRMRGWIQPAGITDVIQIEIDPRLLGDDETRIPQPLPKSGMTDQGLWLTAMKMKSALSGAMPSWRSYADALSLILRQDLLQFLGMAQPAIVKGGLGARQCRLVEDFMQAHFLRDIPLATLAALTGLSLHHFAHAFRRSFGLAPHQYQLSLRMAHAKKLLAGSDLPVTAIAHEVGFTETSSFSRAFRRLAGTTPSAFRRESC